MVLSGEYLSYFSMKTCCGYSLEAPHRGTSKEYPQHMFLWRNKKNIKAFWLKKMPYLVLCTYVPIPRVNTALHKYWLNIDNGKLPFYE